MDGPPFSVGPDEVRRLYSDRYQVTHLIDTPVQGGLKGHVPATETVWRLIPT